MTGGDVSIDAAFFNKWTYPFVLVFLTSLIGCHLSDVLDMKKFFATIIGILILGFGGVVIGLPTHNMLVNLGFPIVVAAGIAVLYNLVNSVMKKRTTQISRSLLHLGIVIVMLGIFLSSTNEMNYGEIIASPDTSLDLGEIQLEFGEFYSIDPNGLVATDAFNNELVLEYTGLALPVTVIKDGTSYTKDVLILLYSLHGIVSRPSIVRAQGFDVYLVLHQSTTVYRALAHQLQGIPFTPTEFVISVIYFPMMNLIWLGTLIMSIGILYPITKMRMDCKYQK